MKPCQLPMAAMLVLAASVCSAQSESPGGFFGGMDIDLGTTAFHHSAVNSDGQALHLGGGGGGKLLGSCWILGGRGGSASLINTTKASELELRYGGLMAICLIPIQPLHLGLEAFIGGGSYKLFVKEGPWYSKQDGSFFIAEPRLHAYYTPFGKLILDLHIGYVLTTAEEHPIDGLTVGFGILFGTL